MCLTTELTPLVQGGIVAILAGMHANQTEASVQEEGCWALGSICWSKQEYQLQLLAADGGTCVRSAIAAISTAEEEQEASERRFRSDSAKPVQELLRRLADAKRVGQEILDKLALLQTYAVPSHPLVGVGIFMAS